MTWEYAIDMITMMADAPSAIRSLTCAAWVSSMRGECPVSGQLGRHFAGLAGVVAFSGRPPGPFSAPRGRARTPPSHIRAENQRGNGQETA